MSCDGDIDELHRFARSLGLRRAWFQEHKRMPHYDLTVSKREQAIALGAVFVPARDQALMRRALATKVREQRSTGVAGDHCGPGNECGRIGCPECQQ
jgi:hypothetical protein